MLRKNYCPFCGAEVQENHSFCPSCGASLVEESVLNAGGQGEPVSIEDSLNAYYANLKPKSKKGYFNLKIEAIYIAIGLAAVIYANANRTSSLYWLSPFVYFFFVAGGSNEMKGRYDLYIHNKASLEWLNEAKKMFYFRTIVFICIVALLVGLTYLHS